MIGGSVRCAVPLLSGVARRHASSNAVDASARVAASVRAHTLPIDAAAHDALREYRHVITVPTRWGDEDSFGHINNVLYTRYAEEARVSYLAALSAAAGVDFATADGIGPILARFECKFVRPSRWPDVLAIGTRVTHFARAHRRLAMEHRMVLADGTLAGSTVALAHGDLAAFDYAANRAVAVPDAVRNAVAKIEEQDVPLMD